MPIEVRYCLLCDGSSDRLLRHPIRWILESLGVAERSFEWADFRLEVTPPRELHRRIALARERHNFDLLFVHRDAERDPHESRVEEIQRAALRAGLAGHVAVVPVRALESWLLHDEHAIRSAAANPSGSRPLGLPRLREIEHVSDPKARLRRALESALPDRPRDRARVAARFPQMRSRVAELSDYGALRQLPAFAAVCGSIESWLSSAGARQTS
ncbi:MAG: hypothetical protein JNK45_32500 [Myxococcales bacterium]|nr:hypothetical protein [Myxococcales bacterium]